MVGVNRGHCGLAVRPGVGGGPLRLHPCCLPELAISARFASAAMESAVRAEALQRGQGLKASRALQESRVGVSCSLLHISSPDLPPSPSGADLIVSPKRLIPTGASWLCSGTGSGARLAQSTAWGNLRDPVASAVSAGTLPSPVFAPETAGWAPVGLVPGQVGTFHFFKWLWGRPRKSLELSAQSWKHSLGILIHDVYLQVQLTSPAIPKRPVFGLQTCAEGESGGGDHL